MRWIDKLERRFGRHFGIPNLMIYLTATMVAVFVMDTVLPVRLYSLLSFSGPAILQGQIWRLITFVLIPPNSSNIFFMIIALYFYYFIGNTLENAWSTFRFTLYYVCGMVGLIIGGMLVGSTTNTYLNLSMFFAFAQLFPDQQVLLFFIIPIKIKYLAYVNWFFFAMNFISALFVGDTATWVAILFSLLNYFLFFGPDMYHGARNWITARRRRRKYNQTMKGNDSIWR